MLRRGLRFGLLLVFLGGLAGCADEKKTEPYNGTVSAKRFPQRKDK